jgi:ribosomal protein S16
MKIQELLDDCKIIREKSYNFTDFLTQPYQQYKESLELLLGTWHLYFYGTHPKFWHNIFKINQNREVEKWFENKLISKGMIELCCPNQYYIQITNHESVDLSLMILNKNDIHKPLFTVSIIDNEWAKHSKKMTSIGLFSRVELTDEEVIQTLGENPLETCLKETPELEDRVAKLCRQMELTKFK